jgi:hypothetical protein
MGMVVLRLSTKLRKNIVTLRTKLQAFENSDEKQKNYFSYSGFGRDSATIVGVDATMAP